MPAYPGLIRKANYVVDLWDFPCAGDWIVYAESALPAGLELFISLEAFDWKQMVRSFVRPKRIYSGKHGRRGARGGRRGLAIPDWNEAVGSYFREQFGLGEKRKLTNGIKTMWKVLDVLERGLFWWMLADLSGQAAFRFTTGVYSTYACRDGKQGFGIWEKQKAAALPLAGWQSPGLGIIKYEQGDVSMGSAGGFEAGAAYTVYCACSVKNNDEFKTVELRLGITFNPIGPPDTFDSVTLGPGESGGLAVSERGLPGQFGSVVLWANGTNLNEFTELTTVVRIPAPIELFRPYPPNYHPPK